MKRDASHAPPDKWISAELPYADTAALFYLYEDRVAVTAIGVVGEGIFHTDRLP